MGEHERLKRAEDLVPGDAFRLEFVAHVVGVEHVGGARRIRCKVEIADDGFDATPDDGRPLEITFVVADGPRH